MKKIVVLLSAVLLLASCHEKVTEEYLFYHPQELRTYLMNCQNMTKEQIKSDNQCVMAFQAAAQWDLWGKRFAQNPQAFGERILKEQMKVSQAEEKLAKASGDEKVKLEKQLAIQQNTLKRLSFVVSRFVRP